MRTDRPLLVVLAVVTTVLVVSAIAMGGTIGGAMGPGMMYGAGSQGPALTGWAPGIAMGLGVLMVVAFWGLIVLGIALLVRSITNRPSDQSPGPDALTILQRRYAAGELDEQAYQRIRRELTGGEGYPREVQRVS